MEKAVGEEGLIYHESILESKGNGYSPDYFCTELNVLVMLQAISWGTFFGYLFAGLLVYYGYVCWKYGLLREWLTGRRIIGPGDGGRGAPVESGGDSQPAAATGEARDPAALGRADSSTVANGPTMGAQQYNVSTAGTAGTGEAATARGTPVYPVGKQMPLGLVEVAETAEVAGRERAGPGAAAKVAGVSDDDSALFKIAETLIGQLHLLIQEAAATQLSRPELERRIAELLRANRGIVGTTCQASVESFLERSARMQLRYALTQADIHRLWGIGVELPDGFAAKAGASAGGGAAEDERIKPTLKQGI